MDSEERRVTHFWYVGWSDHSSPEATIEAARSLLQLVQDSESCRHSNNNNSSLPSTPAPGNNNNNNTPTTPSPHAPRPLSRQAAEEWSDADYDLRFPGATAFDLSEAATIEATNAFDLCFHPSTARGYRASDPAPAITGAPHPPSASGPVVVHCSAGVGRTGCFIALCIACEQLCNEGKVDVLGIVSRLRLDRGGMVENSEQYTFLHAALCTFQALRNGRDPPALPAIANLRNQFTGPLR